MKILIPPDLDFKDFLVLFSFRSTFLGDYQHWIVVVNTGIISNILERNEIQRSLPLSQGISSVIQNLFL